MTEKIAELDAEIKFVGKKREKFMTIV